MWNPPQQELCERYVNHRSYEVGASLLCRLAKRAFCSSFHRSGSQLKISASGVRGRLVSSCVR